MPPSGEGTSPRLMVCPADRLHKLKTQTRSSALRFVPTEPGSPRPGPMAPCDSGKFLAAGRSWRALRGHHDRVRRRCHQNLGNRFARWRLSRITDSLATKTLVLDGRLVGLGNGDGASFLILAASPFLLPIR